MALLRQILERNELAEDDIISILFTATEDMSRTFPATAARAIGLGRRPAHLRPRARRRRVGAPLHPGHAPRAPPSAPGTRSTTSTSRAPKDSVTTSPTEVAPARQPGSAPADGAGCGCPDGP